MTMMIIHDDNNDYNDDNLLTVLVILQTFMVEMILCSKMLAEGVPCPVDDDDNNKFVVITIENVYP